LTGLPFFFHFQFPISPNNNPNNLIPEIEYENLHLKYNAFICNPIENQYYELNKIFLSKIKDENMNNRDYQLQILNLNNNDNLNQLYTMLKNKVNNVEIQKNTWYFINNHIIFDTFINTLKKGGKFSYPFRINNSIILYDIFMFKKVLTENLEKITKNKIIYNERRDIYLRIISGELLFPNSLLFLNIKLIGKKEKYFELIQEGIINNNLMYYINNLYRLFKKEKSEKIQFSDTFDDFVTDINTSYNHIFTKNSRFLQSISENDILDCFLDITNLYLFFLMLYIKNFENPILIDIVDKECFHKTIVIQHI
jgi:hypothetical protein